jgi:hypothetical protein
LFPAFACGLGRNDVVLGGNADGPKAYCAGRRNGYSLGEQKENGRPVLMP